MRRLLLLILSVSMFSGTVFAEEFVAGKDYVVLPANAAGQVPAKVTVTEFFSYGCPWCARLDPSLEQWVAQQGDKITFNRVPVVFKKDWDVYAKAYYTALALSKDKEFTPLFFQAIIKDKKPLNNNALMVEFFKAHGVDEEVAKSAFYHSPSIDLKLEEGKQLMGQYQITGVPTVVVNRQYKTDIQMAESQDRLYAVLNYLVEKAKSGQ